MFVSLQIRSFHRKTGSQEVGRVVQWLLVNHTITPPPSRSRRIVFTGRREAGKLDGWFSGCSWIMRSLHRRADRAGSFSQEDGKPGSWTDGSVAARESYDHSSTV